MRVAVLVLFAGLAVQAQLINYQKDATNLQKGISGLNWASGVAMRGPEKDQGLLSWWAEAMMSRPKKMCGDNDKLTQESANKGADKFFIHFINDQEIKGLQVKTRLRTNHFLKYGYFLEHFSVMIRKVRRTGSVVIKDDANQKRIVLSIPAEGEVWTRGEVKGSISYDFVDVDTKIGDVDTRGYFNGTFRLFFQRPCSLDALQPTIDYIPSKEHDFTFKMLDDCGDFNFKGNQDALKWCQNMENDFEEQIKKFNILGMGMSLPLSLSMQSSLGNNKGLCCDFLVPYF